VDDAAPQGRLYRNYQDITAVKLTSPSQVAALLQEHGLQPNSLLGQNFLIDANIRDIIIAAADLQPEDVVLEVGPGLGVLTERLVGLARRVIAVEKDRGLFDYLCREYLDHPSLALVRGDAMDLDVAFFEREGVTSLVSNLPYSVGSRILMNVFALPHPPKHITVTVQLEVGERLAAAPGAEERGLMGVWAQRVYDVETVKIISPSCFYPRPKIKSAVVRMTRLPESRIQEGDRQMFARLTKESFAFRRKQMATILTKVAARFCVTPEQAVSVLFQMGLDPRIRPEMLTVNQWQTLADGILKYKN
jgi:16S rRNA (adenine1518-N6/adenine1519-N6)-dimethyltransferase